MILWIIEWVGSEEASKWMNEQARKSGWVSKWVGEWLSNLVNELLSAII